MIFGRIAFFSKKYAGKAKSLLIGLTVFVPFFLVRAEIQCTSISSDTLLLDADFSGLSPAFFSDPLHPESKILAETPERLLVRSGSPEIRIVEIQRESESIRENVRIVKDVAADQDEIKTVPSDANNRPYRFAAARTLGEIQGHWLIEVQVYPFAGRQNQSPERAIKLRLQLTGSRITPVAGEAEKTKLLSELSNPPRLNKSDFSARSSESAEAEALPRLKIRIQKDGFTIIPQALVKASGWDVSNLDPRMLRIRGKDGEIPIRVTGEEDGSFDLTDAVEFWGERIWDRSIPGQKRLYPHSDYNVYWLEAGTKPGIRMGQEEGLVSNIASSQMVSARSYVCVQHEEKDVAFDRFVDTGIISEADYWIYTRQSGGDKSQIRFHLVNPDVYATALAGIRVSIRGQANSTINQPVDVFINDKLVVSGFWSGTESVILESNDISPTVLFEDNELTLVNRSSEKELAPLFLDWFEISYPKLYKADQNHIRFNAPPNSSGRTCRFQIEGFTDRNVDVYKIGASKILGVQWSTVMDTLGNSSQTMRFEDNVVDESVEYVALAPAKKMLPDSVELVRNMALTRNNRGADYIAIVASDSLSGEALQPLIRLREEQGLKCATVRIDSIYNEFSSGVPDPAAIRRFLQYARQNWNPPPRWVALIGDGSTNNRSPADKGNVIPVKMVQTLKYGATVSDYWYTVSEDGTPFGVAIGRLPVGTRAELNAVVHKIVDHEKSVPGPWKNRYLMIAAGSRNDGLFGGQTETLIRNVIPPQWSPDRLFLTGSPADPDFGSTDELMDIFKNGIGWINFRGHGGGGIWYDQGLLTLENMEQIENKGKLPFITSMTCYTGDFSSTRDCLGEALLTLEENGAVAFWGTSGAGWTYADYYMLTDLMKLASVYTQLTLGELIQKAKSQYYLANPGDLGLSEIYQYNLLGDPALKWTFPTDDAGLTMASRSVPAADSIRISGKSAAQSNQLLMEWYGTSRSPVASWTFGNLPKNWSAAVAMPPGFKESRAGIRAYAWDEKTGYQAGGSITFSIGKSRFDSLKTLPEKPTSRDSILFAAQAQDASGVKKIWCKVISPRPDSIAAMPMAGTGSYITSRWYGPSASGSQLAYYFMTENGKGIISRSDTVRAIIPAPPDLAVMSIQLAGSEQVFLESEIMNYGGEDVQKVPVQFECPAIGYRQSVDVSVPGGTTATARAPFPSFAGMATFLVSVNPDSSIRESSYRNNLIGDRFTLNRFNVTPSTGSLNIDRFGQVGLIGKLDCFVPPGALSKTSALLFETLEHSQLEAPVPAGTAVTRLTFSNVPASFSAAKEILLIFHLPSGGASRIFKPYRFEESIQKWVVCAYSAGDSGLMVQTRRLGLFCLLAADDHSPPVIELQANGQPFSSGSYVSSRPQFSVLIQDSSGVDIRPEQIHLILDGVEQDPSLFSMPDSTLNPALVTLVFRPVMKPGNHTLLAKASDVHGNSGQTESVTFNVSETFDIRYLGNHPNPFKRETIFVYVLTDAAERVTLRVYTVSGRRIRSFDEPDMAAADYHEVVWDGKDEWGEETANGAYFFRLTAEKEGIHKEITGKIARLR
jgi:hypothetical protein